MYVGGASLGAIGIEMTKAALADLREDKYPSYESGQRRERHPILSQKLID